MIVIKIIFWLCLALVFYTYIGYGIVLAILVGLKRAFGKKRLKQPLPSDIDLPEVTLMICAYNEEDIVASKMENTHRLNYPKGKLKVMWVTDGSNDSTNERLAAYEDVTVVYKPEREGKTAALNHGLSLVKSEITVMTDANTMAAQPATCDSMPPPLSMAMPVAAMAPTTVTPDSAFMPDMRGVCNRLGTWRMMK